MPVVRDRIIQDRRIRFRTNSNASERMDDLYRDSLILGSQYNESTENASIWQFLKIELTRSYFFEQDEERYSAKREKIYSFMKIPRELEKFLVYGVFQCVDSFLFVFTFLPLRILLAIWAVLSRPFLNCFGLGKSKETCAMKPAEICDLLKACILVVCCIATLYIDTSVMYHIIKSQSVIKLYLFFNILEVSDRLFSSFGQDTIDALFWTAIEPKDRKREHIGVLPHLLLSIVYVFLHSLLVLFQTTTLNVAFNSSNKSLLTIMISNQFVELKGSVFKKFDKNNLFQVSCSDVRERFHLFVLLLFVVLQTMKEYSWKEERFWILLPDCIIVLVSEVLVDWIKHAFISRFNELPADVYRDYTISLAYDVAQTRQKNAFTDHSDWVSRRMGFIPLPLSVVMFRVLVQTVSISNMADVLLLLLALIALAAFRVFNSLIILGRACDLIGQHKQDKAAGQQQWSRAGSPVMPTKVARELFTARDTATSPTHPPDVAVSSQPRWTEEAKNGTPGPKKESITTPRAKKNSKEMDPNLGPSPIFSNSTVDIDNVCLNEELLRESPILGAGEGLTLLEITRSTPDIQTKLIDDVSPTEVPKRVKSEPAIPCLVVLDVDDLCSSSSDSEQSYPDTDGGVCDCSLNQG